MSISNNFFLFKAISLVILIFIFSTIYKATGLFSASEISLPSIQTALASADLNMDGKPDLIIGGNPVGNENGKIRVLLGNGNGTFGLPTEYVVGVNLGSLYNSPYVEAIKIADLDADGNLDVVVVHNEAPNQTSRSTVFITVLFGESDGRLIPAESYALLTGSNTNFVNSMAFGDFNTDGKLDIVLSGEISGNLGRLYFLNGEGNRRFTSGRFLTIGASIFEIITADFDNDAFTDLIMTTADGVLLIYGDGNYFNASSRYEQRDIGLFEMGLAVKDFNADGRVDFAVAELQNNQIRVYLNSSNGLAASPNIYNTNFSTGLLKSVDLNGDGKFDLVISDKSGGDIQIFYGDGSGAFNQQELVGVDLPISDFNFADFDGNGKTDIAFSLYRNPPASQAGVLLNAPRRQATAFDFDGDSKADISVFRPENGSWYLQQSTAGFTGLAFGLSTDKLAPGDYDGDGKTDVAVVRNGIWYLQRSQAGFTGIQFGTGDDVPVPADYDGDGKTDIAVFRPSNGTWYLLQSTIGFSGVAFGLSTDKPIPADYDGDGKTDIAVNRNGNWYIQRSLLGFTGILFGAGNDKPVPADYDGDGKADIAVFRPSNGIWYLLQSSAGFSGQTFGFGTDTPVPADYDGDGKTDIAVVRNGNWYINRSSQGFTGIQFGTATDKAIPNSYLP